MNSLTRLLRLLIITGIGLSAPIGFAQSTPTAAGAKAAASYKVVKTAQDVPSVGGIDYVFADSANRRLYVSRSTRITVFDLDTLKSVGEIPNTAGSHGAVVDPVSNHGFSSSVPVVMFDAKTLATIKTIEVARGADGYLFEPSTEKIYILNHGQPNVTVIDGKDGSISGTIDLGGAPEQAASDGQGHVYIDVENQHNVAVVDVKTMTVTAHYDLGEKGGTPAGLALDAKNGILFAYCRDQKTCVILSAADGKIITTLPTGQGCDGAVFNPATMEAFSSQGDGTLTVIKENSPTSFEVEQTVATKSGAKTCTFDSKTGQVILITTEAAPAPAQPAASATTPTASATAAPATPAASAPAPMASSAPAASGGSGGRGGRGGQRGGNGRGPAILDILVVAKS